MITATQFRKDLKKIMPGYKWTVHRPSSLYSDKIMVLVATGIRTSGMNRMSTLEVTAREKNGEIEYDSRSSGFGKNAPWLSSCRGETLAQSLRGLQDEYEYQSSNYAGHAYDLKRGRDINGDVSK
jgi:hypothetical protein